MGGVACKHKRTEVSNLSEHGVNAEVTVCSDCGKNLDYRPLRPGIDVPDSEGEDVAAAEARIQAAAKAAKALEIGLAEEYSSGEGAPLPAGPTGPGNMGDWVEHPSLASRAKPCPGCGVYTNAKGKCENVECELDKVIGKNGSASVRDVKTLGNSPCQKHGGAVVACDTGTGKANRCKNSQWGSERTFAGPCACRSCHAWPKGMVSY